MHQSIQKKKLENGILNKKILLEKNLTEIY